MGNHDVIVGGGCRCAVERIQSDDSYENPLLSSGIALFRDNDMKKLRLLQVLLSLIVIPSLAAGSTDALARLPTATGHYLLVWAGDRDKKGNDFLAVIDADPSSASYGHLLTTLATDQQTVRVHHTEYAMPASGMLFANDHDAGRTFIFDVREPLHPKIVTSFTDMGGYMHPHSYVRLPNGKRLGNTRQVGAGCHRCGSSSSRRLAGCVGRRLSTSLR